jgi:hypothetical protein
MSFTDTYPIGESYGSSNIFDPSYYNGASENAPTIQNYSGSVGNSIPTQTASGWSGTPQANGSGGSLTTTPSWLQSLFPQGIPGLGQNSPLASGTSGGAAQPCTATNWSGCGAVIGGFATQAAVVVLGFIFVAAGLFMFGKSEAQQAVEHVIKGG